MADWFANPSLLWLGLLAGPVVLLFMLRHKPVVKRVSSTLLWAGVSQMNVATSPFSRLRRSLSLLLMLLLLLCLVLALAGLRIPSARTRGHPLIVVIDVTASMQAATLDRSRLDIALARAAELIDAAGDCPVTILRFNGSLLPASPADCEPAVAKAALKSIVASDLAAGHDTLAAALKPHLEAKRKQRVAVISDHAPSVTAGEFMFIGAGAPATNAGIVAAGVSQAGTSADLFFGLELHGEASRRISLKLERVSASGSSPSFDLADARDLTLSAGKRAAVSFRVARPGLYRARIEQDDALLLDNVAYVRYVAPEKLAVALEGKVPQSLTQLIAALDFVSVVDSAGADTNRTAFVFTTPPANLPRLPAALLGPGATLPQLAYSRPYDASEFAARPSRSFLWRGAGVPDIRLGATCDIESRSFLVPLLEAGRGTCMGLMPREQSDLSDLIVGFDLDHELNNFRSKYAYVIFWSNWFEYVRGLLEPLPQEAVRTSQSVEVARLANRGEFSYERLGGSGKLTALPGDVLVMDTVGIYRFDMPDAREPLVGVSLLDAGESDTARMSSDDYDAAALGARLEAFTKSAESSRADYDLRPWLALAALALLLFDWFWFRRRFPLQPQPLSGGPARRGVTALRKRKAGA